MLRAVIFDFDGVITDSEVLHFRSFNKVLSQFDFQISNKNYYRDYLGLTDLDFFSQLIEKRLIEVESGGLANLLKQKNEEFKKLAESDGKIIEGVREFLVLLRDADITMGICSGALSAEIELTLEHTGLRSYFEVIVSADHVRMGKPSPEGYLLALEQLKTGKLVGLSGNECVVIEDSHWGLEAAKAAGMHTIAVTNSYDADQLTMAEMVVSNLSDIKRKDIEVLFG